MGISLDPANEFWKCLNPLNPKPQESSLRSSDGLHDKRPLSPYVLTATRRKFKESKAKVLCGGPFQESNWYTIRSEPFLIVASPTLPCSCFRDQNSFHEERRAAVNLVPTSCGKVSPPLIFQHALRFKDSTPCRILQPSLIPKAVNRYPRLALHNLTMDSSTGKISYMPFCADSAKVVWCLCFDGSPLIDESHMLGLGEPSPLKPSPSSVRQEGCKGFFRINVRGLEVINSKGLQLL